MRTNFKLLLISNIFIVASKVDSVITLPEMTICVQMPPFSRLQTPLISLFRQCQKTSISCLKPLRQFAALLCIKPRPQGDWRPSWPGSCHPLQPTCTPCAIDVISLSSFAHLWDLKYTYLSSLCPHSLHLTKSYPSFRSSLTPNLDQSSLYVPIGPGAPLETLGLPICPYRTQDSLFSQNS